MNIERLYAAIATGRFDYSDEAICQNQIADHLNLHGIEFKKEHRLDQKNICDFWIPDGGLAIEVKAGKSWSKMNVYRQVERYCRCEQVNGLILATGKVQGLPDSICGKPIRIYQLGLGFL